MKDIKLLAKELLSLTNKSECDESTIARMKNLICYLSEHKKNYQGSEEDKNRLDYIIYTACVKMRTFGYNRLNGFKAEDFIGDNLSEVKENAILKGRIQTLQNSQEHDCERLLYGKTAGLILKIFN